MKNLNIWQASLALVCYVLVHVLLSLAAFVSDYLPDSIDLDSWAVFDRAIKFALDIIFVLIVFLFLKKTGNWEKILVPFNEINWLYFNLAIILGVFMIYVQNPINWVFSKFSGFPAFYPYQSGYDDFIWRHVFYIISTVLITPVIEELFFRGFLFKLLKERYQVVVAILVSSLFFALIHVNWLDPSLSGIPYVFITFIGGILLSIIYHKSNRILYPILLHISWNFIAATAYYWNYPFM